MSKRTSSIRFCLQTVSLKLSLDSLPLQWGREKLSPLLQILKVKQLEEASERKNEWSPFGWSFGLCYMSSVKLWGSSSEWGTSSECVDVFWGPSLWIFKSFFSFPAPLSCLLIFKVRICFSIWSYFLVATLVIVSHRCDLINWAICRRSSSWLTSCALLHVTCYVPLPLLYW